MSIIFSDHAMFQLKKRRISHKRVLETVKNPEKIIPGLILFGLLQFVKMGILSITRKRIWGTGVNVHESNRSYLKPISES